MARPPFRDRKAFHHYHYGWPECAIEAAAHPLPQPYTVSYQVPHTQSA